jgi:hypothetical protein
VPELVGETDNELEVGAYAGLIGCLGDELQVAVAIGDRAGFLVEVGGGEDDVGEDGGVRFTGFEPTT